MYAINLADWMAHKDDFGLSMLLQPVANPNPAAVVECEKNRLDGASVLLECEQDRAGAIVEIVRRKYKRHQLRIYESKAGKDWKRV